MKEVYAIVFGGSGFIGSALVKGLLKNNYKVVAIGRQNEESFYKKNVKDDKLLYLSINSEILRFLESEDSITLKSKDFFIHDRDYKEEVSQKKSKDYKNLLEKCEQFLQGEKPIFFHAAWLGKERLTDGDLKDQMLNLELSYYALMFAKALKVSKFINMSSQEEKIFADYIASEKWKNKAYDSSPLNYAFAKNANFEMLSLVAYLEKIDFVNTRFSVVLDRSLEGVSFVAKNFLNIKNGDSYSIPNNQNPCEIVLLEDLINAYIAIGQKGKNKGDYYLGSGIVSNLPSYFKAFYSIAHDDCRIENEKCKDKDLLETFSPKSLNEEVDFYFDKDFHTIAKDILCK